MIGLLYYILLKNETSFQTIFLSLLAKAALQSVQNQEGGFSCLATGVAGEVEHAVLCYPISFWRHPKRNGDNTPKKKMLRIAGG